MSTGKGRGGQGTGGGQRMLGTRVKTARGRKPSSTRWLERQLNDPYVIEAKRQGWRSRAAFKLIQLDDRFHLLTPGKRVVDLGAAPGGWTQVAAQRVLAPKQGKVVAIDYLAFDPVPGAEIMLQDFLDPDAPDKLKALLEGPADIVMSDMAAPTTGHAPTDHVRIVGLAEAALDFAIQVLAPNGAFIAKLFQGGSEKGLLDTLRHHFASVRHVKPPASRADSVETYIVAIGFREGPGKGQEGKD